MKKLKDYLIPFVGLKNKIYFFNFSIDRTFFSFYDNSDISECNINVDVEFDKRESYFKLIFKIDGHVQAECDRCLEPIEMSIFGDYALFVKFDEFPNKEKESHDVTYISRNQTHLDVSKYIYDYILLSIPLKKAHESIESCNSIMINKLENQNNTDTDPRWDTLKNLKKQ